jgi:hypothetical protein
MVDLVVAVVQTMKVVVVAVVIAEVLAEEITFMEGEEAPFRLLVSQTYQVQSLIAVTAILISSLSPNRPLFRFSPLV